MVIAVLVLIGVDLVVVGFLAVVIVRRRSLTRRPDAFRGAVRLVAGEVEGLRAAWSRGLGRRVRNVLVWNRAPLLFRTLVIPLDGVIDERDAIEGEVSRLGDAPHVIRARTGSATIEIAVDAGHAARLADPAEGRRPPSA